MDDTYILSMRDMGTQFEPLRGSGALEHPAGGSHAEAWEPDEMRDVRNKIVHDYLPGQTQKMFDDIMEPFFAEMKMSKGKIDRLFK